MSAPGQRRPQNLTQKSDYNYLPDAPTIVTVSNYEADSPYHTGVDSAEEKFQILAQIYEMAIAFVFDFSKQVEDKLDFHQESLNLVDKIINNHKSTDRKDIEVFMAECGSYVGMALKGLTLGKGQWHPSYPKYFFSGFRFPFKHEDKEGKEETVIAETSPYAAVAKRLIALQEGQEDKEPAMEKYVAFILDKMAS